MFMYLCIYVFIYLCVYIFIFIYIYIYYTSKAIHGIALGLEDVQGWRLKGFGCMGSKDLGFTSAPENLLS